MGTGHKVSGGHVAVQQEISDSDVTTMETGAHHVAVIFVRLVFLDLLSDTK